jgi:hypothetical protein
LFSVAQPAYYASVAISGLLLLALWDAFPAALLVGWFRRRRRPDAGPAAAATAPTCAAGNALAAALGGAVRRRRGRRRPAVGVPVLRLPAVDRAAAADGRDLRGRRQHHRRRRRLLGEPAAYYGFCVLPFSAVVLQLALQGGRTYPLLALMVVLFGGVMTRVSRNIHASIVGTLRAGIENETLVSRLAAAKPSCARPRKRRSARVAELQQAQDAYGRLAAEEKFMLDTLPVGVAFFSGRVIERCNRRLEQMLELRAGRA